MRLSDVYMGSIIFFLLLEIFHDKLNIKLSIVSHLTGKAKVLTRPYMIWLPLLIPSSTTPSSSITFRYCPASPLPIQPQGSLLHLLFGQMPSFQGGLSWLSSLPFSSTHIPYPPSILNFSPFVTLNIQYIFFMVLVYYWFPPP